ncbi:copper resistance protein CopC [Actinokineospora sp. UTMC 2448]|uniref:copper resistance protein CopC n=1 Tax=Actinokineospora sp. UTMC 2448 TaxID=2268449 RepID=UPI0037BF47D7
MGGGYASGVRRVLAVALVVLFGLIGSAGTAFAHNQLVSSNPADKASVETGPATVELTFDQAVQGSKDLNTVVIVGPGDTQWQGGEPTVSDNKVTVPVRELGPAGEYRVGYQILSADGHPVRGEIRFTLTKAGNGTPAEVTTPAPDTTTPESGGGVPVWVWIVGAVVLLGVGVVTAMRLGGGSTR